MQAGDEHSMDATMEKTCHLPQQQMQKTICSDPRACSDTPAVLACMLSTCSLPAPGVGLDAQRLQQRKLTRCWCHSKSPKCL